MKQHSSSSRAARPRTSRQVQRKSGLAVGRSGDRFEREADRAADAVAEGRVPAFAFSRVPVVRTQRDDKPAPKSDEEKYKEAAKKAGEAFLETAPGKEITEKAEKLGDAFVSTLPGKVITGAAITGAVAALAATHKELPIGIPDIPLDKVRPGLTLKITYEGPVDKPTKVVATFSLKLGPQPNPTGKTTMTESEKFRAETARMQKDLFEFKQGLKSPQERAAEERALSAYLNSRFHSPLISPVVPGAPGKGSPSGTPSVPDVKLTGESEAPAQEPKKEKEEESEVKRKATSDSEVSTAPPIVDQVLASQGAPLDASTRVFMESRFGFDFSKVRIHSGSLAADSARAINAVAYTVGHDVVFASGAFSPNTIEGRRLLAHELTHIIQQESPPQTGGCGLLSVAEGDSEARTVRRKKDPGTEPDPLAKALKGDDDDVRDLTNHSSWNAIALTASQAATLIIELLKGATLDDDEQAGLAILRKMVARDLLDASLEALDQADRFGQLLDDYHGSEYRDLLALLSNHIRTNRVRALLLDEFISMWWLNYAEQKAVVVLLELTRTEDRIPLLGEKDRVKELRGDIGNRALAMEFEAVVTATGEKRWEILSTSLSAVFTIQATESTKSGQRTKEETDALLKKAAADLAAELLDYKHKISEAQRKKGAKPKDIAEINEEFKRRLDKLLDDKKAEFGLELKYNIEFNRLLEVAWGRKWFQEDLKEIDDILQKIPYDILHLNINLQAFERSLRDPENKNVAGMATGQDIQLRGDLSLHTTAHEIGHFIHDNNAKLFEDFQKLSEWSKFDRAGLAKFVTDEDDRKKLEKKLDEDYEKGQKDKDYDGDDHKQGNYIYRYSRYEGAGHYVRHHKDACFIRTYASTEPKDDFADSFGYMFSDPEELRRKCPDKYEFMLVRVLTDYRLSAEKDRVLDEFDRLVRFGTLNGWNFETDLKDKYLKSMRKSLEDALDKDRTAQVDLARKASKSKAKPSPIPHDTGVRKIAQPVLEHVRRFIAISKPAVDIYAEFRGKVVDLSLFEINDDLQDAFGEFAGRLDKEIRDELMAYLDPLLTRVVAGEDVKVATAPELDAIKTRYLKSLSVIKPYLPDARDALTTEPKLFGHLVEILRKITSKARRERVRVKLVALRDSAKAEIATWLDTVTARIRDGKAFNRKAVRRPSDMLTGYKTKATKIARETK